MRQGHTLRHYLSHNNNVQNTCCLNQCPIKAKQPTDSTRLCFQMFVIFEIACTCRDKYIELTKRQLHVRVKEHLHKATTPSAVFQHHQHCNGEFSTRILARGTDAVNLQIKEAHFIWKKAPASTT
uniref:Uncharacterized protein n=1 Tax=Octopus bimaculoides TaxID=37653 RepID=A0A0L8G2P7_OCTBM